MLQEITEACRGAVRAFVEDRTDSKGRVSQDSLNNFARSIGFGQQPWTKSLKVTTCNFILHFGIVLPLLPGKATGPCLIQITETLQGAAKQGNRKGC